ncbi:hypothetical protein [Desertibacillus haloalkaliphilus]|uniref:hypothetical protein n=1 Tax=Desertibacillus haloalkaliphilus TaxID=1328930 RepID=UPI001C258660|nr:hypothetical protein [Desertibacillus haloalkaliphilus]MBU8905564.1 hypothetical protein [Desertibacillus haloalkaliphilus]
MAVHLSKPHIVLRGDQQMEEKKYDATYKLGKTTVHVVAPEPMSEEERYKRVREFHLAGWSIWNDLSTEKKLELNKEATAGV